VNLDYLTDSKGVLIYLGCFVRVNGPDTRVKAGRVTPDLLPFEGSIVWFGPRRTTADVLGPDRWRLTVRLTNLTRYAPDPEAALIDWFGTRLTLGMRYNKARLAPKHLNELAFVLDACEGLDVPETTRALIEIGRRWATPERVAAGLTVTPAYVEAPLAAYLRTTSIASASRPGLAAPAPY
jgi:hypothetical protein